MTCRMEDIEQRILRILNGEATSEELRQFSAWLKEPENQAYFQQFKELWNLTTGPVASAERTDAGLVRFRKYIRADRYKTRKHRLRRMISRAAVLFIPLSLGAYFFFTATSETHLSELPPVAAIQPGLSKAILTTAEGQTVALSGEGLEKVAVSSGLYVQQKGAAIVYHDSAYQTEDMKYNRLEVPRGGEYKVILSDGTEVYMNSASELRYPIVFGKEERKVYLSGEAYFKVKKQTDRPFIVCANAVKIRVYGTSFNVNTHLAGKIQTVLVEGAIGISGKDKEYRMQPSQLAEFDGEGHLKQLREVDVKPYVAWHEGLFLFEDQSLEEILTTLSLWYDVDIFYASQEVKNLHFTGFMQRYEQIDRILNAISKMVGVQFKISGKTIVVSK